MLNKISESESETLSFSQFNLDNSEDLYILYYSDLNMCLITYLFKGKSRRRKKYQQF